MQITNKEGRGGKMRGEKLWGGRWWETQGFPQLPCWGYENVTNLKCV